MDERVGLWINKRLVKALELPLPHDVSANGEPEGWLLNVRGPGKAVARFIDGDTQAIDLREGDFVLSSSDALYVSRSLERADHRGNVPREERFPERNGEPKKPARAPKRRATTSSGRKRSSG